MVSYLKMPINLCLENSPQCCIVKLVHCQNVHMSQKSWCDLGSATRFRGTHTGKKQTVKELQLGTVLFIVPITMINPLQIYYIYLKMIFYVCLCITRNTINQEHANHRILTCLRSSIAGIDPTLSRWGRLRSSMKMMHCFPMAGPNTPFLRRSSLDMITSCFAKNIIR